MWKCCSTFLIKEFVDFSYIKILLGEGLKAPSMNLTSFVCTAFENRKRELHYLILLSQISLGTNLTFNRQFWILAPNSPQKRDFLIENGKTEYHHWILHIKISLDTTFQLKLTTLIFLDQICPKSDFWSKTEKVNTTIEFWLLELV